MNFKGLLNDLVIIFWPSPNILSPMCSSVIICDTELRHPGFMLWWVSCCPGTAGNWWNPAVLPPSKGDKSPSNRVLLVLLPPSPLIIMRYWSQWSAWASGAIYVVAIIKGILQYNPNEPATTCSETANTAAKLHTPSAILQIPTSIFRVPNFSTIKRQLGR